MPAPIFSLATTGTDPKATSRQALEDEINRVIGVTFDQANPEDRDSAALSAENAAESEANAAANTALSLSYKNQAEVAAIAAGAPIVTTLTDPVPANDTVEVLQTSAGGQVWQVVGGAWEIVGWLTKPEFRSIAAMALASGVIDGQGATVLSAFNGGVEHFDWIAGSTLTADGELVVGGVGGQWVSKRTVYADWGEMNADPRGLPSDTALMVEGLGEFETLASGGMVLSGGLRVRYMPVAGVYPVKAYGAIVDGTSHPLSERYATLADAQAAYPSATSLTQEIDFCATLRACELAEAVVTNGTAKIYLGEGKHEWGADTLSPKRKVRVYSDDTMEGVNNTEITVNLGNKGIWLRPEAAYSGAQGSEFKGFLLQPSERAQGGRVIDYNAADGKFLGLSVSGPAPTDGDYEVRVRAEHDQPSATMTLSNKNADGTPRFVMAYNDPAGTFQVGETVTYAAGGTATILFVSSALNVIVVTATSGSYSTGTMTGATSGATANNTGYAQGVIPQGLAVFDCTINSGAFIGNPTQVRQPEFEVFCKVGHFSHGIHMQRRGYIEEVTAYNFGGDGFCVASGDEVTGSTVGNANLTRIHKCRAGGVRRHGVNFSGGDANDGSVTQCTMTGTIGFAGFDNSFLGNNWADCHGSLNHSGGWFSQDGIGSKAQFDGMYAEGFAGLGGYKESTTRAGGAATTLGGVHGLPIEKSEVTGRGGAMFDSNMLRNDMIDTDATKRVIFKGVPGVNPSPLAVSAPGNESNGRGVYIDFETPWRSAASLVTTAYVGGKIGMSPAAGKLGADFFARKNLPPTVTVTGTGGSNALILPVISEAGVVTAMNVLYGGRGYPTNGTTITVAGGTGATFRVNVRLGIITSVDVLTGGTGYASQEVVQFARIDVNGFQLNGTKVVGDQQPAIADSAAAPTQAEFNAVLAALRAHGLIAT